MTSRIGAVPAGPQSYLDRPAPEPKRTPRTMKDLGIKPATGKGKDNVGFRNIVKVLNEATPEEREYWGRWYPNASAVVRQMAEKYKLPFETVAGVVAVMSPGNRWHQNVEVARQVILWWKAQQEVGPNALPQYTRVGPPVRDDAGDAAEVLTLDFPVQDATDEDAGQDKSQDDQQRSASPANPRAASADAPNPDRAARYLLNLITTDIKERGSFEDLEDVQQSAWRDAWSMFTLPNGKLYGPPPNMTLEAWRAEAKAFADEVTRIIMTEGREELDDAFASLGRTAQLGRPYVFEPLKNQPEGLPATVFREKKPRTYPLGQHGPTPAGYPANVDKALAILDGADPMSLMQTSPKVSVFYKSLVDPESVQNELVLDGHAINIWRGQKRTLKGLESPTVEERERMLADYQKAADRAGLPVQAVQAITWYIWKNVTDAAPEADTKTKTKTAETGLATFGDLPVGARFILLADAASGVCKKTSETTAASIQRQQEANIPPTARVLRVGTGVGAGRTATNVGAPTYKDVLQHFETHNPAKNTGYDAPGANMATLIWEGPVDFDVYDPRLEDGGVTGYLNDPHEMKVIRAYAERIKSGSPPPAIILSESSRGELGISDGSHRLEAARLAGLKTIPAYIGWRKKRTAAADQLPGGAADDKPVSDFDLAAIAEGTQHELEHTDDEALASEIARDRLVEDPNYYEKLKKIEASGRWFHGTHSLSGLDAGDDLDPKKGNFEPAVWCTSTIAQALVYAHAASAIHPGSTPIVFEVEIRDSATLETVEGINEDVNYEEKKDRGVDALVFKHGEGGTPMLAILTRGTARVQSVVKKIEAAAERDLIDLLIEAGPPNEWSGGVASALGDKRKDVEALWESLNASEQAEVEAKFHEKFDADWEAEFGEPREAQARPVREEPSTPPPWLEGAQRVTKEDAKVMLPMDGSVWLTNDGPWYYVPALPISAVPRVKPWSPDKAREYADLDPADLPPIVLEAKPANDGSDSWRYEIVDGEHRTYAARLAKLTAIPAYVGFPVEHQPRPRAAEAGRMEQRRADFIAAVPASVLMPKALEAADALSRWARGDRYAKDDADAALSEAVAATPAARKIDPGMPNSPLAWFMLQPGPGDVGITGGQMLLGTGIPKFNVPPGPTGIVIYVDKAGVQKSDRKAIAQRIVDILQHELLHVEQFSRSKGKLRKDDISINPMRYYERPHEIEAYANGIVQQLLRTNPDADFRSTDTLRSSIDYIRFDMRYGKNSPNPNPDVMNRLHRLIFEYAQDAKSEEDSSKVAAFGNKNYWVDPAGQSYETPHTHDRWALANRGKTANDLLDAGWVRVAPPDAVQVRALSPEVVATVRSVVTSLLLDYPDRAGVWVETDEDNLFVSRTPTGRPDFTPLRTASARTAADDSQSTKPAPWTLPFKEYIESIGGNKTHPRDAYEGYVAKPFYDIPSTLIDAVKLSDGREVEIRRSDVAQKLTNGKVRRERELYAVLDGWIIGAAQDEWGATLILVDEDYRGAGVGKMLAFHSRREWPQRGSGGMTPQGYALNQHVHKMFVADALARGEDVPPEVLAEYPDIQPAAQAATVSISGEPAEWSAPPTGSTGSMKPIDIQEDWERQQFEEFPRIVDVESAYEYGHPLSDVFHAMGKPIEFYKRENGYGPGRPSYSYAWPNGKPSYQEVLDFFKSRGIKPDKHHQYSWTAPQLQEDAPQRPAPVTKSNTARARTAGRVWGYLREGDVAGRAPGIFLRIPRPLADQFPATRGDDESPPHFTLAYVLGRRASDSDDTIIRGKSTDENPDLPPLNDQDRQDMVAAVSAALNGAEPFEAFELTLGEGVDWFENGKGEQIAHKEPEKGSEGAAKLEQLATRIRDALGAEGFVVSYADKPFLAHATLAYLPTREYEGPVPEGTFPVDHVALWGWPETWLFDLEGAHQQSKAAAPTKLRPRGDYDHVCPHCDEIIYEKHVKLEPPDYEIMKHLDCGGVIELTEPAPKEKEARAYHGTPGGFHVFEHNRSGLGTHFGTELAAEQRGQDLSRVKNFDSWEVREYELSVSNPLRLPDVIAWDHPHDVAEALANAGVISRDDVSRYEEYGSPPEVAQMWAELRASIEAAGYDAVVYKNMEEGGGADSWIVWDNSKLQWMDVPAEVTAAASGRWAGAYPRFQRNAHGEYEEEESSGSQAHPHADGAIPGVNEQVTNAPGSQYAELAKNWGTLTPGTNSDLRFYDYRPYAKQVDDLVRDHGYDVYFAGGKYGKPDLANRNYQTGHLMIYDPTPGSGGDFGDEEYTRTWRTIHELSHAKSLEELNAKYGEGRRIGKLGWQRTPREAKRAVEWEWLAAHKQRELGEQMGYFIDDATFNREVNCVDAETEALTQRGWVKGFDLKLDDVLLTKNPGTGALEWQTMTDLRLFPDYEGPVVEFRSESFHAVTTPKHRWLVTTNQGRVRERTSATIVLKGDQIHRTGKYPGATRSTLSADEASLLGWFVTDGHYHRSTPSAKNRFACLSQSTQANAEKCAMIDALLARLDVRKEVTKSKPNRRTGQVVWRFGKHLTQLMELHAPNRRLEIATLLHLDHAALWALRDSMMLGDGSINSSNKDQATLVTGRREQADAFQILLTLTGTAGYVSWRNMSMYSPKSAKLTNVPKMTGCYNVALQKRRFTKPEKSHKFEYCAKVPMWCPVVPNTFFVARRSGQVFVTGNTVLHDAVHRAITGQFTNPDQEGFVPSDRIVPLEVALSKIDEAAQALGLESDDALLTPEQRQQLKLRAAGRRGAGAEDAAPLTLYAVVSGDALIAASEDDDFAELQREAEAYDPRAPWTVYQLDDVPVDLARKLLSVTSGIGFGASLDPQRALVEAQPFIGAAVAERAMARRALKKWKQDRRRRRRVVNQVWYKDSQGFLRPTLSAAGDQREDRAAVDAGPQAVALPTNLKIQSIAEADLAARALQLLHETLSEEARASGYEAIRVGDRMLLVTDVPSEPVGHLSPYTDLSDEGDGTDQ